MNIRLNNLYICKQWLTNLGLMTLTVRSDKFVGRCSTCGLLNTDVVDAKIGRYSGDLCDKCIAREQEFINELNSLDDSLAEQYMYKKGNYGFTDNNDISEEAILDSSTSSGKDSKKPIQVNKPSKKRAILEDSGQRNLFDFY